MTVSMPSTYAFEPTPQWTTVNPKPLLPLHTRSEDFERPPLPSPLRNELFNDRYTVSTHLVPAACPRITPDIPLPILPEFSDSSEKKRNIQRLATEMRERQELFVQGRLCGERSEKLLWNCVNRYAKRAPDGKKGLTLFLTHAVGFPKEVFICLTHGSSSKRSLTCDIDRGSNSKIFIIITHSFADRRGVVMGGCSAW
jgi:hypothetical protein